MIDKYQILSPDEFKAFVNEKGLIDRGEGDRHIFLYDKNDNRYHFKYEMVEPDMEEHFMYIGFDTKEEVLKRKEAARLNPLTIEDLKNEFQKHLDHFKNIEVFKEGIIIEILPDLYTDQLQKEKGIFRQGMNNFVIKFTHPHIQESYLLPASIADEFMNDTSCMKELTKEYEQHYYKLCLDKGFIKPFV